MAPRATFPPGPFLPTPVRKVGFLYLRAPTQIYHSIGIAIELSRRDDVDVALLCSSEPNRALATELNERAGGRCKVELLHPGWLHQALRLFKKRPVPKIRVVMRRHRERLLQFDAVVSTNRFHGPRRNGRPLQVHTGHGAVGRIDNVFYEEVGEYDLMLVPGEEKRRQLIESGTAGPEKVRIVGYPKFDVAALGGLAPKRLFDNDRPVVAYSPHFRRDVGSWHAWGTRVLDFFVAHPEYNLVVAPHANLFAKKTDPFPQRYLDAPNIHVDLDSRALYDMTYTASADLYLGDVSSQVYEFVAFRRRPCLFLNSTRLDWQARDDYRLWRMGPVLDDIDRLGDALQLAFATHPEFVPVQDEMVRAAFSVTDVPAGERGARAIVELLDSRG